MKERDENIKLKGEKETKNGNGHKDGEAWVMDRVRVVVEKGEHVRKRTKRKAGNLL